MYILEAEYDDLDDIRLFENSDKYYNYFYEIMNSNLSILRMYISICESNQINKKIKARVNNNFYCDCIFHNATDLPLRIAEDLKAYACYGCGCSGTIVTLISKIYNIPKEESIELLHGYINNETNGLNKRQLNILKQIFQYYDSPTVEKLFEESQKKTELLNKRIKKYIKDKDCYLGDEEKIANRLCCSKKYVKKFIPNTKKLDNDESPF